MTEKTALCGLFLWIDLNNFVHLTTKIYWSSKHNPLLHILHPNINSFEIFLA